MCLCQSVARSRGSSASLLCRQRWPRRDVIIELTDGRWAAIETKLGDSKVDQGVKNLLRLEKKVLNNPLARGCEPVFKAVVVGSGAYARQLSDSGIYVIPLDTLTV